MKLSKLKGRRIVDVYTDPYFGEWMLLDTGTRLYVEPDNLLVYSSRCERCGKQLPALDRDTSDRVMHPLCAEAKARQDEAIRQQKEAEDRVLALKDTPSMARLRKELEELENLNS